MEDWSTECVDLVALDGLVFFTDGSLCGEKAGAVVLSNILNVRESFALGSHAFNPKYMLFWRVRNIAFRKTLSIEQYQSALIVRLLCWPLNRMPCLSVLYYSAENLFRNWLCLTKFDWCGFLDTVVSMGMRSKRTCKSGIKFLWGRSHTFECQAEEAGVAT
jgi:hypothetical protein